MNFLKRLDSVPRVYVHGADHSHYPVEILIESMLRAQKIRFYLLA